MKRFICVHNDISVAQANAIRTFCDSEGLNWWHWIKNSWLLIDARDKFTASSLYNGLHALTPDVRKLVVEVPPGPGWKGFGPSGEKEDMFNWLHQNWSV